MQRKQRKSKKRKAGNDTWNREFDLGGHKTKMRKGDKAKRNRVREALRAGAYDQVDEVDDE